VFQQIAGIAQEIVPHDYLSLGLLSEDGRRVRIHARHGPDIFEEDIPEYPVPESLLALLRRDTIFTRDADIVGDHALRLLLASGAPGDPSTLDATVDDYWWRVYKELGIRSALRATVRLSGRIVGGLEFDSRRPDAYGAVDAELAMRVAD